MICGAAYPAPYVLRINNKNDVHFLFSYPLDKACRNMIKYGTKLK
jgi:hypothetical protein